MKYVFLSSTFYMDPAVETLSLEAEVMFVRGIAYCGNAENGGVIGLASLPSLRVRQYLKHARELVDAGLWIPLNSDELRNSLGLLSDQNRNTSGLAKDSMRKSRYFADMDDVAGFTIRSWDNWQVKPKKQVRGGKAESGVLKDTPKKSQNVGTPPIREEKRREEESSNELSTAPAARVTKAQLESLFDRWYSCYPRKAGRGAAKGAFEKALNKIEFEKLLEATIKFSQDPNLPSPSEKQFIPMPSTWLNQERWDDEPLPPRSSGNNATAKQRASGYLGIPDISTPQPNYPISGELFADFPQLALN